MRASAPLRCRDGSTNNLNCSTVSSYANHLYSCASIHSVPARRILPNGLEFLAVGMGHACATVDARSEALAYRSP